MLEIKKINDYLKGTKTFIDNPDEIMEFFSVEPTDFESRYRVLELIVEYNKTTLMNKKRELKTIEAKHREIAQKSFITPLENGETKKTSKIISTIPINDNVQLYIDLINDGMNIKDVVEEVLKRDDGEEILSQMLLTFYGEIRLFHDMAKSGEEDAINEIEKTNKLIEEIKKYSIRSEEIDDVEASYEFPKDYKIAFYKTPQNNIEFLSDLKYIPYESYEDVKECLDNLLKGTPKKSARFSNGKFQGMFKTRINKIRINYMFIDGRCVILGVFVKKQNMDQNNYMNNVRRMQSLKLRKDLSFDDEESKNEAIEILSHLEGNKRVVK